MARANQWLAVLMIGLTAGTAQGQGGDMMSCPLDQVRFLDSGDGTSFEVDQVGQLSVTPCGDPLSLVPTDQAEGRSDCLRPNSYTILDGRYLDASGGHISDVWAVWSVLPAAPCCGWSFDLGENAFFRMADVGNGADNAVYGMIRWSGPGTGPAISLGELGAQPAIPRTRGPFASDTVLLPIACTG